jgi:hypothetical protein
MEKSGMDRTVKWLVILFAAAAIALFGFHWAQQWHNRTVQQALEGEKAECLQRMAEMEAQIHKLGEELETQQQGAQPKADFTDVFGSARPLTPLNPEGADCNQVTREVVAFFTYLDSKAYLVWPGNSMRAEELFDDIYKKLVAAPPINVGEMEELSSLVRNVAHFYRVLGKDRIELLKEILKSESAVLEPAISVIFTWMTACNGPLQSAKAQHSLGNLYPYACFFLNTLGGRSYLLRRDAKLRILVSYYALLIVDMANDAKLNSYGLDIRPHLDYVFYDINNQKGLMYRQRYLARLVALQSKYQ